MKKQFTFLAVVTIFAFGLNAQLDKGSLMIGGSGSFGGGFSSNGGMYDIILQPNAGVFILPKFAIGAGLGMQFSGQNYSGGFSNDYFKGGVYLSPFARYYFLKKERKFNLLAQVGFSFGTYWFRSDNFKNNSIRLTPNIKAGMVYFIRPQIALEALINVSPQPNVPVYSPAGQIYGSIGFQIHLDRKSKTTEIVK